LISQRGCDKIPASLSDPKAVVPGKGVIAMGKLFKVIVQKIVAGTVSRLIYDWLKHLFDEDDDD
jgi:hypothetical protein